MFFALLETFGNIIVLEHFNLIWNVFDYLQGAYQVAKWNGTRVSVKILDKDSYSDPERMYASTTCVLFYVLYLSELKTIGNSKFCFLSFDLVWHEEIHSALSFWLLI